MNNLKQSVVADDRSDEHRAGQRKRALLPAVGCDPQGEHKFDCTIRDLSETGARIGFSKGTNFSQGLQIINVRDKLVYEARVVWCGASEAGVSFVKTRRLADLMTPLTSYLSRLWFERANR